jgi:hypothetical protein
LLAAVAAGDIDVESDDRKREGSLADFEAAVLS